jgi:hypothetical protein
MGHRNDEWAIVIYIYIYIFRKVAKHLVLGDRVSKDFIWLGT